MNVIERSSLMDEEEIEKMSWNVGNFSLESFFNEVSYEDDRQHSKYSIKIKDKIISNLEYKQIHLVTNVTEVLIYLTFTTSKGKQTQFFKVNLGFVIHMTYYNIEVNEDLIKINLFLLDNNLESKENLIKILIYKNRMRSMLRSRKLKGFYRKLNSNADFVYLRKLKGRLINLFKLNYYLGVKEVICDEKFKRMRKLIAIKSALAFLKWNVGDHKNIPQCQRRFYGKVFFNLTLKEKHIKLCLQANRLRFNEEKKLFEQLTTVNKIQKFTSRQIIKSCNRSVSVSVFTHGTTKKVFSQLKLNAQRKSLKEAEINNFISKKLKEKVFQSYKQYKSAQLHLKIQIAKYNKINFSFMKHIITISKELQQQLELNEKTKNFNRHNILPVIKNIFNLLKNFHLVKLISFSNFAKLAILKKNQTEIKTKQYNKRLLHKMRLIKKIIMRNNIRVYFNDLSRLKGITSQKNAFIAIHKETALGFFLNRIFLSRRTKVKERFNLDMWSRKWFQFKFFTFLTALFNIKQRNKTRSTISRREMVSPKGLVRQKIFDYVGNVRQMYLKFYFYKLLVDCKKNIINKMRTGKLKKRKVCAVVPGFIRDLRRRVNTKKLNTLIRQRGLSFFVNKVKEDMHRKKMNKCIERSYEQRLKAVSFFILGNYYKFKTAKTKRDLVLMSKLGQMMRSHYANILRRSKDDKIKLKRLNAIKMIMNRRSFMKKMKLKLHLRKVLLTYQHTKFVNFVLNYKKQRNKEIKLREQLRMLNLRNNMNKFKQKINLRMKNKQINQSQIKLHYQQFVRRVHATSAHMSVKPFHIRNFLNRTKNLIRLKIKTQAQIRWLITKKFTNIFSPILQKKKIIRQITQKKNILMMKDFTFKMLRLTLGKIFLCAMLPCVRRKVKQDGKYFLNSLQQFNKFKNLNKTLRYRAVMFFFKLIGRRAVDNIASKVFRFKARFHMKEFMMRLVTTMKNTEQKEKIKKFVLKRNLKRLRKCRSLEWRIERFREDDKIKVIQFLLNVSRIAKQKVCIQMGMMKCFMNVVGRKIKFMRSVVCKGRKVCVPKGRFLLFFWKKFKRNIPKKTTCVQKLSIIKAIKHFKLMCGKKKCNVDVGRKLVANVRVGGLINILKKHSDIRSKKICLDNKITLFRKRIVAVVIKHLKNINTKKNDVEMIRRKLAFRKFKTLYFKNTKMKKKLPSYDPKNRYYKEFFKKVNRKFIHINSESPMLKKLPMRTFLKIAKKRISTRSKIKIIKEQVRLNYLKFYTHQLMQFHKINESFRKFVTKIKTDFITKLKSSTQRKAHIQFSLKSLKIKAIFKQLKQNLNQSHLTLKRHIFQILHKNTSFEKDLKYYLNLAKIKS